MWQAALLVTCFQAGFLLGIFFVLTMEATYSSKSLADFQQTTQHYIPEDMLD
jgi:hypothetical protein